MAPPNGTANGASSATSNQRTLPLGILELSKRRGSTAPQALADMVELARLADRQGYRRFWVAEHHVGDSSHAAPEVVVAALAARTTTMHIGAGAVLLRYYSPLKVAETFLALEALFPGRIDLGIARGPGVVDRAVARRLAWGHRRALRRRAFGHKASELERWLAVAAGWASASNPPTPADVTPPPLWVLGSGASSRELAARLGVPFAAAAFTDRSGHRVDYAGAQIQAYRTAAGERAGTCALALGIGEPGTPYAGDPDAVVERLVEVRDRYGIDELILTPVLRDAGQRRELVAAIAESWWAHAERDVAVPLQPDPLP